MELSWHSEPPTPDLSQALLFVVVLASGPITRESMLFANKLPQQLTTKNFTPSSGSVLGHRIKRTVLWPSRSPGLKQGFLNVTHAKGKSQNQIRDAMSWDPWMWVPVNMAWRVLGLRMEERPPIWRVAVNKLNKKPRTADKGWSSSLGVERGANNPSPYK